MKKSLLLLVLTFLPLMVNASDDYLTEAKQKLASLYKYANRYEDKPMEDESWIPYVIDINNPDSLADANMETDIIKYLLLNLQGQTNAVSIPRELYNPDVEVEIGTTDVFYNKDFSSYYKVGEGT